MIKGILSFVFCFLGVTLSDDYINLNGTLNKLPTDIPDSVTRIMVAYSSLGFIEYIEPFPLLEHLDLRYDNLTRFPNLANISSTLKALTLSHNKLDLEDGIPHFPVLYYLDLAYNYLTYIPDLSKVSATLTELLMDGNYITSMDALPVMPLLQRVNFDQNNLISFPDITKMPKLNTLHLCQNDIRVVEDVAEGTQLTLLYLKSNNLETFPAVDNALQLEELDLAENNISHVETVPLLPKLRSLSLASNNLMEIPDLTNLSSVLESLNCSDNDIEMVEELPPMPKLLKLYLHSNKITQFPDLSLVGNTLEELYIHYNDINVVPTSFLASLTNLKILSLGETTAGPLELPNFCAIGNKTRLLLKLYSDRLICNTEVLYMILAVTTGKLDISVETDTTPVCTEPSVLAGKRFTDLRKEDLIYSSNNNKQVGFKIIPSTYRDSWGCSLSTEVKLNVGKSKCALICLMQPHCYMFTVDGSTCVLASTTTNLKSDLLLKYYRWFAL